MCKFSNFPFILLLMLQQFACLILFLNINKHLLCIFDYNSYLRVSISNQTAVVNISGTYQGNSIIYYHKFAVNIDNLSNWNSANNSVGT